MIQVIDNEIKQYRLPKTGKLKDGSTISGYNLLPKVTLYSLGWYDIVDKKPDYNPETHHLLFKDYEIDDINKSATKIYEVVEIKPNEFEELKEAFNELLGRGENDL